ncbi:sensor histidine kinase [Streptomyces sp. NPDC101151]|uniref:sensor histidine kinase n=1 Tax=Streptomyces sp. NPDC101151 TaxID=3366115 RepID=UPI00382DF167
MVFNLLLGAFLPGPMGYDYFPSLDNPVGVPALAFLREVINQAAIVFNLLPFLLAVVSLVHRFWIGDCVGRQRLKWVVLAVVASVGLVVLSIPCSGVVESLLMSATTVVFSTGVMIAIVRYRLFDIDWLLSRALLYGVLTGVLVGLYTAAAAFFELVMQSSFSPTVSLLATAVVAALMHPVHGILQRAVSRLVYGLRDDPYAVLVALGRRLSAATDPQQVLPQVTATVGETLRLPYVAVELYGAHTDGSSPLTARFGAPVPDVLRLALIHHNEEVGALLLGARSPGESFSAADLRLLADVSRHTAQAAAGVRLTLNLLRAGRQLTAARAEERRRLGRELHDSVNSVLSEVVWGLQAARKWLPADPEKTDALLAAGLSRTHEGVETVRRISQGLRSPVDEVGLIGAVRAYLERFPLPVDVELPDELPEMLAASEEALYWIMVEALTNALRHAKGDHCSVRLEADSETLTMTIADNGRGLPEPLRPGVGLGSMRERAAEVGGDCQVRTMGQGGTQVVTRLPRVLPGITVKTAPSEGV